MQIRDLISLTKPAITLMCLLTLAVGLALAPAAVEPSVAVSALLGTALLVGSSNALNMWWERETDACMSRTRGRALPDGRLAPAVAFGFAVAIGAVGFVLLAAGVGWQVAGLGAGAHLSYVLIYTPLKKRTPHALLVGAIPGAMPPMMGWVAATGRVEVAGLALFALLFFWQMPHFIAIALRMRDDYARGGIRTISLVHSPRAVRLQAVFHTAAMVVVSFLIASLCGLGALYLAAATIAGILVFGACCSRAVNWDARLFRASLAYLPLWAGGLVMDLLLF